MKKNYWNALIIKENKKVFKRLEKLKASLISHSYKAMKRYDEQRLIDLALLLHKDFIHYGDDFILRHGALKLYRTKSYKNMESYLVSLFYEGEDNKRKKALHRDVKERTRVLKLEKERKERTKEFDRLFNEPCLFDRKDLECYETA